MQQVQELQQEVRKLRGNIEVQNHKLEQLGKRQRDLYADVDQRLRKLSRNAGGVGSGGAGQGGKGGPPLTSLAPVTGSSGAAAGAPGDNLMTLDINNPSSSKATAKAGKQTAMAKESSQQPKSETAQSGADIQPAAVKQAESMSPVQIQAQYQDAFKLLKQSHYDEAIRAFQKFLAAHPDSNYADNAQYWLAEAYYVTGNYKQALKEYRKLVKAYPDSQKLTGGLLKIGYTLQELGKTDEARQQLQALVQKYPGTTAARLAEERLQRLNADAAAKPAAPAKQD
ncbi:MAG: tol-pal system protein YbgF [Gammaproteobacteria bacterium]